MQWFGQSINFYWQVRAKGSSIFRKIIPYFLVRTLLEGMRTKWLIHYVEHSINFGFKRCKRIYWLDESSFHCPYFILAWNGFNGPRGHSSRWYLRVLWKTVFTSFTLLFFSITLLLKFFPRICALSECVTRHYSFPEKCDTYSRAALNLIMDTCI